MRTGAGLLGGPCAGQKDARHPANQRGLMGSRMALAGYNCERALLRHCRRLKHCPLGRISRVAERLMLCRTTICMSIRRPPCQLEVREKDRFPPRLPLPYSSITHSGSWKMSGPNQTARSSTCNARSLRRQAEEETRQSDLRRHVASLGYTTAWCFSISHSQILADPNGWLANLQPASPRAVSQPASCKQFSGRTDPSWVAGCNPATLSKSRPRSFATIQ